MSGAGTDISHADDITQIVFHPGHSRAMLCTSTVQEVTRINTSEREWSMKPNKAKLTVVPITSVALVPLRVKGDVVHHQGGGTLLGL